MMEVDKREIKLKKHKDLTSKMILKNKNNNKRQRTEYSGGGVGVSKFFLPEKRARRNRQKFLFGGNICDPLNLNSLQNESETNDDEEPTTSGNQRESENKVELIIPPNINDPLNLLSPVDKTEYELQLTCNALNKKKRKRKRYKSGSEYYGGPRKKIAFPNKMGTSPQPHDALAYDSNVSKESSDDEQTDPTWEIINDKSLLQKEVSKSSPALRKPSTSVDESKASETGSVADTSSKHEGEVIDEIQKPEGAESHPVLQKTAHCQYGNYNRYYGFESLNKHMDVRLKIFQRNVHLFKNKDVLDIGCNCGLLTLAIAKNFSPKSITGIDIDRKLINIARSKLKKYVTVPDTVLNADSTCDATKYRHRSECFPISFPICYGNMGLALKQIQKKMQTPQTVSSTPQTPYGGGNETQTSNIPECVSFEEMNYVPKDEVSVFHDAGKYDLILCLSVTKWIHLNYGDQGLRLTFRKIFSQLRPGGKLILELQNWPSYKKKKKMNEQIYENYKNINFHPSSFADFLLSQEIGFSHFYTLGVTQHLSKGFRRPIYLFVKGEFTPKAAQKWSDVYFPSTTPYTRRPMVYTRPMNLRYAPLPSWLSPMPSPYPQTRISQQGTPYYNPQQSDSYYVPSYDDVPRNHQFAFMSPSSHSSSPHSPSQSKRSIDDDQHSPSRHHLYHLITDPPKSSESTQNSND